MCANLDPDTEPNLAECLKNMGFKQNPFGEKYPYYEKFWAMPERDKKILEFLLPGIMNQSEVLNVLIQGEYGTGKTYALRYLSSFIENDLKGVGIYFQIEPKYQLRGFVDVYTEIVRGITSERIIAVGKMVRESKNERPKFESYLQSKIDSGDLVKAISNLVFDEEIALTWTWLKGEATIYQQRSLGLEESPKDESIGLKIITGLIDFLLLGYPIVGFCIDELENLIGESRAIRSIREGMRNLFDILVFDRRSRSVEVVSSVTAELLYQVQSYLGMPLLDRVDRKIVLKPLTKDEAKIFVQKLFAWARENKDATQLCPPFFDDAAFDEFLAQSKINSVIPGLGKKGILTPRRIIKTGKYLIQTACFDGKPLDSEYIHTILKPE